jgi:microcystin-dependent protein
MAWIGDLNPLLPTGTDPVSQGDDELRAIKQALQDSFPGLDTATWQKADATRDDECATLNNVKDIFPVGHVMFTTGNTNPGTTFGGTWTQIAEGRFVVGVGQGTDNQPVPANRTYAVGEDLNGEYQHTLVEAEMPAHVHGGNHVVDNTLWYDTTRGTEAMAESPIDTTRGTEAMAESPIIAGSGGSATNLAMLTSSTGNDTAHENSPPAFGLYVWERTA